MSHDPETPPTGPMPAAGALPDDPACHGLVAFEGPDARTFLQGQVTQDLARLAPEHALTAAFQTAAGRVVAILRLLADGENVLAVLPRVLAAPVAARLARYTLRARVRVRDASAHYRFRRLAGIDYASACARYGARPPAAVPGAARCARAPGLHLVERAGGRTLIVAAGDARLDGEESRDAAADWVAAALAAGDPEVGSATTEAFTAHMLNLDLLDAVSFTKGCYVGQEIVARTQHRGRVKRRLFRYRLEEPGAGSPPPQTPLSFGATRVGETALAGRTPRGIECLAVVQLDARDLALVDDDGRRYLPEPLPYPVPS